MEFTHRLAGRGEAIWEHAMTPLLLGGDCSILLAAGVATARRERVGLIHIDGHTDFRHPGNSTHVASLAGEDLVAVVGLHWNEISNIDGLSPYFLPGRVAQLGHRADDEHIEEVRRVLAGVFSADAVFDQEVAAISDERRSVVGSKYWVQVDGDVLDPTIMPAVDSPSGGGLSATQLTEILAFLAPNAIGASVTVYAPDLDPDGSGARMLVEIVSDGSRRSARPIQIDGLLLVNYRRAARDRNGLWNRFYPP